MSTHNKLQQMRQYLPVLTHRAVALFFTILLLSESTAASASKYRLKIAQQPATTSQDATRTAAQKALEEGFALYKQGTAESLKQAIVKLQEALKLWKKVGGSSQQALTLLGIGLAYNNLGEKQQALSYYNQALPLYRAVGDKVWEAVILNNIGLVYSDLGEKRKALEYFNSALPLSQAVGDKSVEATALNNIGLVYDYSE